MKMMELFRLALAEIGNVSAEELSSHLEMKHGVKIEPAFIPLYKATLQDLERMNKVRQAANSTPLKQSAQAA
jgi:chemotaxis protein CheY-P-specific phosphatase CheC